MKPTNLSSFSKVSELLSLLGVCAVVVLLMGCEQKRTDRTSIGNPNLVDFTVTADPIFPNPISLEQVNKFRALIKLNGPRLHAISVERSHAGSALLPLKRIEVTEDHYYDDNVTPGDTYNYRLTAIRNSNNELPLPNPTSYEFKIIRDIVIQDNGATWEIPPVFETKGRLIFFGNPVIVTEGKTVTVSASEMIASDKVYFSALKLTAAQITTPPEMKAREFTSPGTLRISANRAKGTFVLRPDLETKPGAGGAVNNYQGGPTQTQEIQLSVVAASEMTINLEPFPLPAVTLAFISPQPPGSIPYRYWKPIFGMLGGERKFLVNNQLEYAARFSGVYANAESFYFVSPVKGAVDRIYDITKDSMTTSGYRRLAMGAFKLDNEKTLHLPHTDLGGMVGPLEPLIKNARTPKVVEDLMEAHQLVKEIHHRLTGKDFHLEIVIGPEPSKISSHHIDILRTIRNDPEKYFEAFSGRGVRILEIDGRKSRVDLSFQNGTLSIPASYEHPFNAIFDRLKK